jgi:hypothetical protein
MDRKLEAAHQELTDRVMGWTGITGTAIGELGGKPCLKVYVTDKGVGKSLPRSVGGFPVEIEVTGPFKAL